MSSTARSHFARLQQPRAGATVLEILKGKRRVSIVIGRAAGEVARASNRARSR
jgi:hypothetical protein